MLAIVTERGDLTADWLVVELERRGAPFLRINTEHYPMVTGLRWDLDSGAIEVGGRLYPLEQIKAVWYRRPAPPQMPETVPERARAWAVREATEALLATWRTLDAFWVNHPDRNRLADSKPEQLRTARRLGFDVPPTLLTNDGDVVAEFIAANPGGVICKPLWDGRVPSGGSEKLFFTTLLDDRAELDLLGAEPYLFQALVAKRYDVRATVIGERVFAVRIESQLAQNSRTDWRRGDTEVMQHLPEQLPQEVAERCLSLCSHYGLQFGAIDLARRPDGGYTFFEINPNGQWAWVEQRTGMPMRSALADLLVGAGK